MPKKYEHWKKYPSFVGTSIPINIFPIKNAPFTLKSRLRVKVITTKCFFEEDYRKFCGKKIIKIMRPHWEKKYHRRHIRARCGLRKRDSILPPFLLSHVIDIKKCFQNFTVLYMNLFIFCFGKNFITENSF